MSESKERIKIIKNIKIPILKLNSVNIVDFFEKELKIIESCELKIAKYEKRYKKLKSDLVLIQELNEEDDCIEDGLVQNPNCTMWTIFSRISDIEKMRNELDCYKRCHMINITRLDRDIDLKLSQIITN